MKSLRNNGVFKAMLIAFILLLPTLVYGECTCEPEEEQGDKKLALKYKIAAIVSIFVASSIGVYIPGLGKTIPALSPEKSFFFVIKAFAAGVILATGFIHVLPDAFENLTCPCLPKHPWSEFPFTGFIAMVAAIATLMVDTYATTYYRKSATRGVVSTPSFNNDEERAAPVHNHGNGHVHGSISMVLNSKTEANRYKVISQVLELGIIVHSVIIGIAVGASESPKTIKPLLVALTFHQFFEGIGLGGCITQAKFKARSVALMAIFFSLTTPVGIAIGIWITKVYSENKTTAMIVEGVFNSASAGILIYMALVDLLSADFMSAKMQNSSKLQLGASLSLLIGAGWMSLLAYWA